MNEYLKKVGTQILEFLRELPAGKKMAVGALSLTIGVCILGLFWWAGKQNYRPLMTNLNPEDSANIVRILREKKIPYQIDSTGRNVEVPPESLDQLRFELASMGLPQSSTVGYELFDKQSFGTTSLVHKVNQKRALEGELMRTIQTIKGVKRSRIHLALPEKSAFIEDQKKPTASVVLDLEPGIRLDEKEIYGVGVLVSRAIEGMDVADVAIMDASGKMLSKATRDALVAVTADQMEFRRKVEEDYERRVQEILGRVVGEGNVIARVTADLDFSRQDETQTSYDADGIALRSQQKDTNSMEGMRELPGGPAGAVANTPGDQAAVPPPNRPQTKNNTNRNVEVANYAVPETVRRTVKPMGAVKKISVAVVVNGKKIKEEKDGKVLSKIEAWPPEKLKEFESTVMGALGIDKKRGDSLDVKNMEFSSEDFDESQKILVESEKRQFIQNLVLYGVIGLIICLFFFFVVRPFIKWITENTIDSVESFLPQTIEELERLQKNSSLPGLENILPDMPENLDPDKVQSQMLKDKINKLVDGNAQKASLILTDWLRNEAKKEAEDKDKDGQAAANA